MTNEEARKVLEALIADPHVKPTGTTADAIYGQRIEAEE